MYHKLSFRVTYESNEIELRKTPASFLKSWRTARWGEPIYSSASFIYFSLHSHAAALSLYLNSPFRDSQDSE